MGVTEVDIKDDSIFKWSAVDGVGEMWDRCRRKDSFEGKVTGLGGILKIKRKRILTSTILYFWLAQPNAWNALLQDREEGNWAREKRDYELNFVCAVFLLYLRFPPERSNGCVRPEVRVRVKKRVECGEVESEFWNATKIQFGGSVVKNPPASAGEARDAGSFPGLRRSPGEGMVTNFSTLA